MFYVFYMNDAQNKGFNKMLDLVNEFKPRENSNLAKEDENTYDLNCNYYSLSIKNGGQRVQFKSEDYNIELKYQFWFDVYTSESNWKKEMLGFIGQLMNSSNDDCFLEANGDTPIVMRKDLKVIVDDKNLNGRERFPFHYLGIDYTEGHLEIV